MAHIDLGQSSPGAVVVLESRQVAHIHIAEARIMPDVKPLKIRIAGYIYFFQIVIKCRQLAEKRII